jgi:predicted deacylase
MRADAARLANVLRAHGILVGTPREDAPMERHLCAIEDYVTYHAPASGLAVWEKEPGSQVRAGDVVARLLEPHRLTGLDAASAEEAVTARDDGILITRHMSPVVYEGLPLFKMMTRVERLS